MGWRGPSGSSGRPVNPRSSGALELVEADHDGIDVGITRNTMKIPGTARRNVGASFEPRTRVRTLSIAPLLDWRRRTATGVRRRLSTRVSARRSPHCCDSIVCCAVSSGLLGIGLVDEHIVMSAVRHVVLGLRVGGPVYSGATP